MLKPAILFWVLIGVGCHQSGEVSPGGSGGAGAPSVGGAGTPPMAGAGGSVVSPGPGAGGFGGPGFTGDASALDGPSMTVDAGTCPFSMAGTACAPAGANCVWSSECVSRRCDCVNGTWTCSERQGQCGGMCPAPQAAQCGDSCSGNASNCLCHCGGGGP